jgi:hypothetical protein
VVTDKHDIRLGDVVLNMPGGLKRRRPLIMVSGARLSVASPQQLRSAVDSMRSDHLGANIEINEHFSSVL